MTLAPMHPMFQVSVDFCDHSSFNSVWKIHIQIYSCLPSQSCNQCRVKVTGVDGIWKCLLELQDWSPAIFLFTNCNQCILKPCSFWIGLHYERWKLCSWTYVCEMPPKQKVFLTAKITFDMRWRLQYGTLVVSTGFQALEIDLDWLSPMIQLVC